MASVRLQRYLAMAGVASRRRAEDLIVRGVVKVNGRVVRELGTKVEPERDQVTVEGRRVAPSDKIYGLLYKPEATVSTLADPEGRPTVASLLPQQEGTRVYPIGRLEWGTEGALLYTNDGDLAQSLVRPRMPIPKTYHAKLHGLPDEAVLDKMRAGVRLSDGMTPLAHVAVVKSTGKHTWIEVTLAETRPRQLIRMAEELGHRVIKLIRVAYAGIGIEGLDPGQTRELEPAELKALRALAAEGPPRRPTSGQGARRKRRGPARRPR